MTLFYRCLLGAIFFGFCLPVFGQEDSISTNYYRVNKTYIGSYFTDFPKVVAAPARYSSKDWTTVAIVVAGTGAVMTLDRSIKQWVQANRNNFFDQTSRIIEPFGNEYSPYIVGAMYLTGVLTKDRRMEHVSLVTAKSLVFTTLLTAGSKQLVRRRRPAYTDDPFEINSMFQGGREWTSFPSGHANTVFTVATAIALQYNDKKWVPYVAYGIAGLTGVSRIYDNRHWATDVILGAAMGHFITKTLYRIEEAKARKKELITLSF
jgi:membrane-associated phospholipid phosphatase